MALAVRPRTAFVPLAPSAFGKAILDAHDDLAYLLNEQGIHDFFGQNMGEEFKAVLPITFMRRDDTVETKISLYRPAAKEGAHRRFWIYGLQSLMREGEILAIHVFDGRLWAYNASDREMVLQSYEARRAA